VTWTLLAPASAIVLAVCALAWSLHRMETEIASLRGALRRSRTTAVATDELHRDVRAMSARAAEIQRDARRRTDLRRSRRRAERR
jgi:hypothetical protein